MIYFMRPRKYATEGNMSIGVKSVIATNDENYTKSVCAIASHDSTGRFTIGPHKIL